MSGNSQANPGSTSGNSNAASLAGADPSMEDILASIRRILSEDETPTIVGTAPPLPVNDVLMLDESMLVQEPQAAAPLPLSALGSFMSAPVAAPAAPAPVAPALPPAAEQPAAKASFLQGSIDAIATPKPAAEPVPAPVPQPVAEPAPVAITTEPVAAEPEPASTEALVAPETAAAASASVNSLLRTLSAERHTQVYRGGPTLEDMVRELVRPMLKEWLDSNLPPMVERIVRTEIERVAGRAAL